MSTLLAVGATVYSNPVLGNVGGGLVDLYPQNDAASTADINSIGNWAAGSGTTITVSATAKAGVNAIQAVFSLASGNASFDLNVILTNGVDYTLTFWARHTGVGGQVRSYLAAVQSGTNTTLVTYITSAQTYTENVFLITHDSTNGRYWNWKEVNATNDGGIILDKITITKT